MLTAALAVLCALLVLVLLVQRPAIWPVLVVLAVLWFALFGVFRYRVRSWVARWGCGGSFEKSKTQFSLEPLSQPAALLSGETVLWYNTEFRTRLMKAEALLVPRVQKVLPGLDLQEARKVSGQLLNLADGVWSAHSSTVPGEAESMTLLVLNEETALRKVEAEYKASRPGYLVFLVDGYDDVFSDMLDSERARLLEGINRVLEDMIGRGTGFLRRVASGRYIAVVEERQLEQFAKRGYDVLDKIRALDPSVNLSISIGIGRGAKTLREAQDMAVQALDMAQGRGGDQAAEMTPDGFTFYGGVSHGVEKRSKVRSRIVADQLVKLIKEADHVVIMGHRMSDLDAIGSAEGVLRICKICDVPAVIAVRRDATLAGESHKDIVAFAKKRTPFNHPAVMYRKSAVEDSGFYDDYRFFEDYNLWVAMLMKGHKGYNVQENLLYMRAGQDMYKRRGGLGYIKCIFRFNNHLRKIGFISFGAFLKGIFVRIVVSIIPNGLRKTIYSKALRK